MKSLKPFKGNCFDMHKKAVNKKHQGELKDRLTALTPLIEEEYKVFLENFDNNTLCLQNANLVLSKSKDDLLTLYKYQSKVAREIRENIKNQQVKTIISTCQNCTIDSANSLDHILPKAKYPEFIINPKNLFPCCTTCNSYKLDSKEDETGQKFLNLYLDKLPEIQYLFVDIIEDKYGDIDFNFYLKNDQKEIPDDFFLVLQNHYEKLHLFERFKLKSIEYVSELESKISAFQRSLSLKNIIQNLTIAIEDEKIAYGHNHWKCILEIELIENELFLTKFK